MRFRLGSTFYIAGLLAVHMIPIRSIGQQADTLDRHWPKYIDLAQYLEPMLTADTLYDESVMMIKDGHASPAGSLLFPVGKVLSVRDTYLDKQFEQGRDWVLEGQRLILTDSSRIPYFHKNELVYTEEKEGVSQPGKRPGTYVLFSEQELLRSRQIAVTYTRANGIGDYKRRFAFTDKLTNTQRKLTHGESMHVVFWGNSIEVGANSSGFQHVPPFMPNWTQLFIYQLRKHFSSKLTFSNLAVGGMTAKWGIENIARVQEQKPDLVVIGFGMNDGTFRVPPDVFVAQVQQMIEQVSRQSPGCEFIVITPMLANPDAIHDQLQNEYRAPLLELERKGVAIADVTYWHQWLLTHKSYQDMIGNNINHPNDYLSRWYAQILLALLIEH